jgi:hypothetical protein
MSMLPKERFLAVLDLKPPDRLPLMDFGYLDDTVAAWREQGLPDTISNTITVKLEMEEYFGLDRGYEFTVFHPRYTPGMERAFYPPFTVEILSDEGDNVVERDVNGVISRRQKGQRTIPQFLSFPVSDMASYEALQWRLDGADPGRYPPDWPARAATLQASGQPLGLWLNGFFAWPRELMGLEGLAVSFYDQPELVQRINQDHARFIQQICRRALEDLPIEYVYIWEDMAYRNGSLISPATFHRFLTPYYEQTVAFLRSHGVRKVLVDCDGYILDLTALFIEAGVDAMLPCERAAGSDPLALRRRYPNLALLGGVDKRALAAGPEAIDDALAYLAPLVAEGGFIPGVDHRVPPDVSLANYRYYCQRRAELFG